MRTEASTEKPLPYSHCGIARQQAAAREGAQQPPAYALLHLGDGVGIEPGGGMEDESGGAFFAGRASRRRGYGVQNR